MAFINTLDKRKFYQKKTKSYGYKKNTKCKNTYKK